MKAIVTTPLTLCDALDELGEATWLEIEQGRHTRHPLDEESVTTYHLMRLAAAVAGVRLEKHTKHREAKSGADWEIWAGRSGALLGFRVQAKILKCDGSTPQYKALFSSKAKATHQIEKLITSAEKSQPRTYPIFIFYNSIPHNVRGFDRVGCPRVAHEQFLCGWTAASAYALRDRLRAVPSKYLCVLVDLMLPVSCLFCCPRSCELSRSTDPGVELVERRSLSLAEHAASQLRRAWPTSESDPASLIGAGPVYAERIYKGEGLDDGWTFVPRAFRRQLTASREIPKGISRVLILKDDARR